MRTCKRIAMTTTASFRLYFAALLLAGLSIPRLHGATYYVAPDGDDGAARTLEEPFATWQQAHDVAGNGNGLKMGRNRKKPKHRVLGCLAFEHRARGFDANGSSVGIGWFNNTAYKNGTVDFCLHGADWHKLRNCISFATPKPITHAEGADVAHNSWNLPDAIDEKDFQTLSSTGVDGPRGSGGELPDLDFLKPPAGSVLVDAGEDVGRPFKGLAPDIGALELPSQTEPSISEKR